MGVCAKGIVLYQVLKKLQASFGRLVIGKKAGDDSLLLRIKNYMKTTAFCKIEMVESKAIIRHEYGLH
jgi:hypothetical protein